jgi:hypothetical protein
MIAARGRSYKVKPAEPTEQLPVDSDSSAKCIPMRRRIETVYKRE